MKLSDIQDTVRQAPDYVIFVVNHLFGIQNHPFWKIDTSKSWDSLVIKDTCNDVFTWWDEKWRLQTSNSGQYNGFPLSSVLDRSSPSPYSTPYDQIIALRVKYTRCPTPSRLGDALKCLDEDYKSWNGRYPDESEQRAVSFQTWLQWGQSASASWSFPPSEYIDNHPRYPFVESMGLPPEAASSWHFRFFENLSMDHEALTTSFLTGDDNW